MLQIGLRTIGTTSFSQTATPTTSGGSSFLPSSLFGQ